MLVLVLVLNVERWVWGVGGTDGGNGSDAAVGRHSLFFWGSGEGRESCTWLLVCVGGTHGGLEGGEGEGREEAEKCASCSR